MNYATWNIHGTCYKDEDLEDILVYKNLQIATTAQTKWKLKSSKETNNYFQFYSGVCK
jgi:hypothetical protein